MKLRKAIYHLMMCATIGTMGAALLISCDNSREQPLNPDKQKSYTVTTESYLLQPDGTLTPFKTTDLRAESEKGSVTGAGTYYHNQEATITATAKGTYKLYTLYEKSGYKGMTEQKGKEGITNNGTTKTIKLPIDNDMHFIAVFMNVSGNERGFQNLKINGTNGNYTMPTLTGEASKSGSLTAIGEEVAPVKIYDGSIIDWRISNAEFKAWEVKSYNASWLKNASVVNGQLNYLVEPYISKDGKARSVTIMVGKDGIGSDKAPSVWRKVTFTQSSFYTSDVNNPTTPDKIVDGDGREFTLPGNKTHSFPATGGSVDIKTLLGYSKPIYALYKKYINGELQPENTWKKVEIQPTYSTKPSWTNVSGTNYSAGTNTTASTRTGSVTVSWIASGAKVGTTTVTFSQVRKEYKVETEVK